MGRTLCVWFPDWPLRRPDAPPDEPCQAVGEDGRVVAANSPARAAGIRPGMGRREAEVLCPGVVTLQRDRGAEVVAFEPVAVAVESLVPRVEVAEPGLLFAPIGGAVRYYGGEEPLADRVWQAVGPGGRVAVAGGPFLARWAAAATDGVHVVADDASFLASLDVGTLSHDELVGTFRWLGLTTLGDLARLPREAVASRFGEAGLAAHRLASGEDRPLLPRPVPEEPFVEERFEEPLQTLEQAGFAARALSHRLMASFQGSVPHRMEVEAEAADGSRRTRVWRSADPLDESAWTERVWWQLRAWLEGEGVPGGLARLRLRPGDVSGRGRQLALGQDTAGEEEALRALSRAQALVGPDRVLQARPQGGRDPGERVSWYRWGEEPPPPPNDPEAPWPGGVPQPAPSLVPPNRQLLEVEWEGGLPTRVRLGSRWVEVLTWAGPWRKLGRWWEGEDPADRYQLVTSAGAFLCEVREGRSYLTGVYD
jgi:protein ImuB